MPLKVSKHPLVADSLAGLRDRATEPEEFRELARHLPPKERESAAMKELASWGCGTTMHVVRLLAPGLAGEDHTKDIDFSSSGIRARSAAGYADTSRVITMAPWEGEFDPMEGVILHEARAGTQISSG